MCSLFGKPLELLRHVITVSFPVLYLMTIVLFGVTEELVMNIQLCSYNILLFLWKIKLDHQQTANGLRWHPGPAIWDNIVTIGNKRCFRDLLSKKRLMIKPFLAVCLIEI
jgi:hypothetical protein